MRAFQRRQQTTQRNVTRLDLKLECRQSRHFALTVEGTSKIDGAIFLHAFQRRQQTIRRDVTRLDLKLECRQSRHFAAGPCCSTMQLHKFLKHFNLSIGVSVALNATIGLLRRLSNNHRMLNPRILKSRISSMILCQSSDSKSNDRKRNVVID